MARVATPAGVDGTHSNFLDLFAVFDSVYAVSWREERKNVSFLACTGCKCSNLVGVQHEQTANEERGFGASYAALLSLSNRTLFPCFHSII